MPMSLTRAERISDCKISLSETRGGEEYIAIENGKEMARVPVLKPNHSIALGRLVDIVYQCRSTQVRMEQKYRCFCCGRLGPLEIDHIKKRSTFGRFDGRRNLRAMLPECHRSRHFNPKQSPTPHPKIVEAMRSVGLVWGGEQVGWERI